MKKIKDAVKNTVFKWNDHEYRTFAQVKALVLELDV